MRKYLFFTLILFTSLSCQYEDQIDSPKTTDKIQHRTDAETDLQVGVIGVLNLAYVPLKSLTDSEIEDIFSSESNLSDFLENESIDEEEFNGYIVSIKSSIVSLGHSHPSSYAANIMSNTTKDWMENEGEIGIEANTTWLPCTTAYMEDVYEAAIVAIGGIGIDGPGAVGVFLLGLVNAAKNFAACMRTTYG